MSTEEVERLKAELAAVKSRAVSKIKQQAQQIAEQQQQIAELRTQMENAARATSSNSELSSNSPSSSGEGERERFVKVARNGEHSSVRRRGERGRSEKGPAMQRQPGMQPCSKACTQSSKASWLSRGLTHWEVAREIVSASDSECLTVTDTETDHTTRTQTSRCRRYRILDRFWLSANNLARAAFSFFFRSMSSTW